MGLADLNTEVLEHGRIADHAVIELLGLMFAERKSGKLMVGSGKTECQIFLFNGIPVHATTTSPGLGLTDFMLQDQRLSPEDVMQVRRFAAERGLDEAVTAKELLDVSEGQIYYYQAKAAKEIVIAACGFREGTYRFVESEDFLLDLVMYDLNPLEIIYEGIVRYHLHDLAGQMQNLAHRKVKISAKLRDYFLLPEPLYEHSDILDIFTNAITVAAAIADLQREFTDVHQAVHFLYLLMLTGLVVLQEEIPKEEIIEDFALGGQSDEEPDEEEVVSAEFTDLIVEEVEPEPPAAEEPMVEELAEPTVEEVAPPGPEPAEEKAAPESDTGYIVTRLKTQKMGPAEAERARKKAPLMSENIYGSVPAKPKAPEAAKTARPAGAAKPAAGAAPAPAPGAAKVTAPGAAKAPAPGAGKAVGARGKLSPRAARELRERVLELDRHSQEALTLYEVLGVSVVESAAEIQEAYDRARGLLPAPEQLTELEEDVQAAAARLRARMDEAVAVLVDPDKRYEHECALFEQEKTRAWKMEMKRSLARRLEERGQWYLRHNAPAHARDNFEQAHKLDPSQGRYFMFLGWAKFRVNPADASEAVSYLHSALQVDAKLDQAHYYLGLIYKREGHEQDAQLAFRAAVELNPQNTSARRELAFLTQHEKQTSVWKKIFGGK